MPAARSGGNSTAIARNVDTMALDGLQSTCNLKFVFQNMNVSGATHTATLALSSVPQARRPSRGPAAAARRRRGRRVDDADRNDVLDSGRIAAARCARSRRVSWLYRTTFHIDEAPAPTARPSCRSPPGGSTCRGLPPRPSRTRGLRRVPPERRGVHEAECLAADWHVRDTATTDYGAPGKFRGLQWTPGSRA